jgi:hypothetical protein
VYCSSHGGGGKFIPGRSHSGTTVSMLSCGFIDTDVVYLVPASLTRRIFLVIWRSGPRTVEILFFCVAVV